MLNIIIISDVFGNKTYLLNCLGVRYNRQIEVLPRKDRRMNLECNQIYYGFKLIEEKNIEEIEGKGRIFEHLQSGARLIQLETPDTNKVFTMSFKTLPKDHSGVAHIIEHAVCCASQKYPLKDTFIEMDKGSLNTSLNACTYKDMTMYYCASQNEKDLLNLMEVYMDLVFHPLIKERESIFKQEGWHYVLEDVSEAITYNGIVYNEMKGDYAEPSTRLEAAIHEALFPDTCYRYDSGGKPEAITHLTREAFLAFYDQHYKPANCTLFLYGDGDLMKQLALLDEKCLKDFSTSKVSMSIPLQETFKKPKKVNTYYPITEEECIEDKTICCLSFVTKEIEDVETRIAFEILEHMLLKSSASPLTKELISEKGLGQTLEEAGYDTGKRQPTFSIVLNGSKSEHAEMFKKTVFEVLHRLVTEGIEKDLIDAALSVVSFGLQEGDTPWEAKGVIYSEEVQMSVLYDQHPFRHLTYKKHLQHIQEQKDKGYFESLIKQYFLDNPHYAFIILEPSYTLEGEEEERLTKQLEVYRETLSEEDLEALIEMNAKLDAEQDEPNTKEALALLPHLSARDLKREVSQVVIKEVQLGDAILYFNPEYTGPISYLHFLFDTSHVKQEQLPYLGLLANLLTYVSTKRYTYNALENEINKQTGGLNCSVNAYAHYEDTCSYKPYFKISCKVLNEKLPVLPDLLKEITLNSIFSEKDKIKEIIGMMKYEIERSFTSSPEYRATRRLYTYFSDAALYEDHVSGMVYYVFLKEQYENFDSCCEKLMDTLTQLYHSIMQRKALKISVTAEEHEYEMLKGKLEDFVKALPSIESKKAAYTFERTIRNEAYVTSSSVQAIVSGFNFKQLGYTFHGALHIASHILDSTYLWDKVRLQGGAYGASMMLSRDGNMVLSSYCDPGLGETLEIFRGIGHYLENLVLEEDELEKYKIGTIGGLDMPLTMEQKSERALIYSLCQVEYEKLQRERDQVLEATLEDIRALGKMFEAVMAKQALCVIGNKAKIMEEADLFKEIRSI